MKPELQLNAFSSFACILLIYLSHASSVFADSELIDGSSGGSSGSSSDGSISVGRLALAALCPLGVVLLSYRLRLGLEYKLLVGIARTISQLLLLGYVLLGFIFSVTSPLWVMLYLLMMLLVATVEVTNRQLRTYPGHFLDSLLACAAGGLLLGLYGAVVVFPHDPQQQAAHWWNPMILVPTVGIIIGNSVPGPTVAVDRLLSDAAEKPHEIELRLCFGATAYEAVLKTVQASVLAALLPKLNLMSVIGLVTIPGMMTGQLIGGATPLVAAEYQMVIIFLAVAATALATFVAVMCALYHAVLERSPQHRLTPHRMIKKAGGAEKLSIDAAILRSLRDCVTYFSGGICCLLAYCPQSLTTATRGTGAAPVQYAQLPVAESATTDGDEEEHALHSIESNHRDPLAPPSRRVVCGTPVIEICHSGNSSSVAAGDVREIDDFASRRVVLQVSTMNALVGDSQLLPDAGLSLQLRAGEVITLEGPSGVGKTRLLRALSLLDRPLSGEMQLNGAHIHDNAQWRSQVLYIPQAVPPLQGTPKELILQCMEFNCRKAQSLIQNSGNRSSNSKADANINFDTRLREVERQLLLKEDSLDRPWTALSGGERQRAVISCGIVLATSGCGGSSGDSAVRVLLLDEPTAACDSAASAAVESALLASGAAIIMVTHDERQAARLANRRIVLQPMDDVGNRQ